MSEVTSKIMPEIDAYSDMLIKNNHISPELYTLYNVKRGLRDLNGKGVLTGLTTISDVQGFKEIDGKRIPCPGKLSFRGIDINDLVNPKSIDKRFGFEETTYLLLFGELPTQKQLEDFCNILGEYRSLPTSFVRDIIMKAPSRSMMNTLARSVLTLYSYDPYADDLTFSNVLRQCLELIALFPCLGIYGYQAYRHYECDESLIIHSPLPQLSTAENILRLLRPDCQYTKLEARILDIALILHAEHGGGNNSTFTCHAVTSSGTDTYSAIAAALGSLKGPKHGGANIKVVEMMEDMKQHLNDWNDDDAISDYLRKLLRKEAFDHAGLIYGIGHAIYSVSDPRAEVFKLFVAQLAKEKGKEKEYRLLSNVERLAPKIIADERKMYKGVSANIDFYSGFVYEMLGLPLQLYTPIFAFSRISGWSAHRLEELINGGKIIRPAYMPISKDRDYIPIEQRS